MLYLPDLSNFMFCLDRIVHYLIEIDPDCAAIYLKQIGRKMPFAMRSQVRVISQNHILAPKKGQRATVINYLGEHVQILYSTRHKRRKAFVLATELKAVKHYKLDKLT